MRQRIPDLLAPPPPQEDRLHVQLTLAGPLADQVRRLMSRYGLEQAAIVRMLVVDGLEARNGRVA